LVFGPLQPADDGRSKSHCNEGKSNQKINHRPQFSLCAQNAGISLRYYFNSTFDNVACLTQKRIPIQRKMFFRLQAVN
jgi:hypothetical protein